MYGIAFVGIVTFLRFASGDFDKFTGICHYVEV